MKLFIFDTVKSACYNFFIEFLWEMEEEYAELPDSYVILSVILILLVKENIVILFRCSAKKAIKHHWKMEEELYF